MDKSSGFPQDKSEPPPSFEAATNAGGPSQPAPFRTRFACVTLNQSDRIRFINFLNDDVAALRDVIQTTWPKGIQDFRKYGQADEFKLRGYPWSYDSSGDDRSRRLVRRMLEALFDRGWVLQAAVDLSKKEYDKDTLVFRYQSPPPPPCDWLSISFDRHDRLKLVDTPPPDLAAAILGIYGSSVSRHDMKPGCFEIKFHGSPWWPSGEETVTTRLMLLRLLEVLERFGYSLYASLDMMNSSEGHETDVLVVHRQKNWVPGTPIWHR